MKKNYINIDGKEIKLSKESIESIKESLDIKEEILVPDNIKIAETTTNKGIIFNYGQQALFGTDTYFVYSGVFYKPIKCKLTSCKREDLKAGDLAYNSNFKDGCGFKYLSNYCKILENEIYAYISDDTDIIVSSVDVNYWWKVEKI